MENASYIESNINVEEKPPNINTEENEQTPKLFSEESNIKVEEDPKSERLFDQNSSDEEDFEIPAFLRKQKF